MTQKKRGSSYHGVNKALKAWALRGTGRGAERERKKKSKAHTLEAQVGGGVSEQSPEVIEQGTKEQSRTSVSPMASPIQGP